MTLNDDNTSSGPYYPQGVPYARPVLGYDTPVSPRRPTSAFVIAIIGLVIGGLGVLMNLWGIVGPILLHSVMRRAAMGGFPGWTASIVIWMVASAVVRLILCAGLIAACVGLIRVTRWARMAMVWYTTVYLGWIVVETLVTVLHVIPEQERQLVGMGGVGASPFRAMLYGQALGGLVVRAAFPIVALVFMTRPNVRRAYDMP